MRQVAEAAGVTRQLLYLHFASRAHLLLEVARRVDTGARTAQRQASIDEAPNAVAALRNAVTVQGEVKPAISAVASAVDRLRQTDADAEAVWREREHARLERCLEVVRRLADEHALRSEWSVETAALLLWSVTSLRAWAELVEDQDWSTDDWVRHTTRMLELSLVADG